jgi:D-glycero-D-manno-heptose 1,7-bisphosphate phosphatase
MLVILDRDGVINEESHEYIKSPEEWHPIPGSLAAIAKLKNAGCQVVVATNQSGIARGLYSEEALSLIHQKMTNSLKNLGVELDGIFYCPHHPNDQCPCRKPEPGLFYTIADQLQADLNQAIMIGDSKRDIEAALKVGADPILVLTGNGLKTLREMGSEVPAHYTNLAIAVDAILSTKVITN